MQRIREIKKEPPCMEVTVLAEGPFEAAVGYLDLLQEPARLMHVRTARLSIRTRDQPKPEYAAKFVFRCFYLPGEEP